MSYSPWYSLNVFYDVYMLSLGGQRAPNLNRFKGGIADQVHVSVCVILDGWSMVSPSMKQYITGLFNDNCSMSVVSGGIDSPREAQTSLTDTLTALNYPKTATTAILENVDSESQELTPIEFAPGKFMDMAFIIKLDNRRKHNSHEWFLRAFAESQRQTATYLFLTDVGTYYEPDCLDKLTACIRDNPEENVAAVAFQRPAVTAEWYNPIKQFHGFAQRYEFYATNYGCVSAFALINFQPVIPGPCQLVKADAALDPAFQKAYFGLMSIDPAHLDLISANMQLAEDRPFTTYLFATSKKKLAFVPDAIFHYELEITPESFLSQRRRWMNGTLAASLLLLATFKDWSKGLPRGRAIAVFMYMLWYTIICTSTFATPAILAGSTFAAVAGRINHHMGYPPGSTLCAQAMLLGGIPTLMVLLSFICFTLVHVRKRFHYPTYAICQILNIVFVALSLKWAYFRLVFHFGEQASFLFAAIHILGLSIPALMSVGIRDWGGLIWGCLCLFPYLLFTGNYGLAQAYSIAQSWNLTWGNRPHDGSSLVGKTWEKSMLRNATTSRRIIVAYLVFNVLLTGLIMLLGYHKEYAAIGIMYLSFVVPFLVWFSLGGIFAVKYYGGKLSKRLTVVSSRMSWAPFSGTYQTTGQKNAKVNSRFLWFMAIVLVSGCMMMRYASLHIATLDPVVFFSVPSSITEYDISE